MLIKKTRLGELPASEITDYGVYLNRRQFLNGAAIAATASCGIDSTADI